MKLFKRLTATMLAAVLMFSMLPSFNEVAWADSVECSELSIYFDDWDVTRPISELAFTLEYDDEYEKEISISGNDGSIYDVKNDGYINDWSKYLVPGNMYVIEFLWESVTPFDDDDTHVSLKTDFSYSRQREEIDNAEYAADEYSEYLRITIKPEAPRGIVLSVNLEESGEFILPTLNTIHYSVIDEDSDKYEITTISGWCSDPECQSTEGLTEVSYCYKRVNIETKGDYKFNDAVTTNFDDDANVTFTRDDDTHAHFIVKKSATAFNGIYINYEKPNNADEMHALTKGDVTVLGASYKSYTTDKEPLYGLSGNPDHIGTDLLIILVSFNSAEDASNIDKKFYFRGEDISDKFYTSEALAIASVDKLDYAVCLNEDGNKYMFIEKFDFSKSANFNVTLNAGMKVSDVTKSVSHNVEQTESVPTEVYITNSSSKDVLPLGNDEVIEAGKTYYLAIRVPKTKYYYDYNDVRLNGKKLALTTNPRTENAAYYSFLKSTESLVVMYEFVPNTPSSGSKRYKTEDNDTTKDVTGIAKKGSKRTIKPIEGRKIKEVIVTDEKGNPIDVTMNEDGTYSFTQPASNVDIKITYEPREMTLEEGTTKVTLDGEAISSDASVISSGDKKLVPIRVVTESLGGTVAWKEEEPDLIQIDKGGKAIDISLSSNVIKVDGVDVSMSTKPVVVSNRTYLPVDFYEDVFNLVVQEYEDQLNSYMKIYENY